MCGIAIEFYGDCSSILDKLKHRGETYDKKVCDGISFGHARLAIQGLDPKYSQPMENDDFVLVYNGEVYNFRELGEKECDTLLFLKKSLDLPKMDGFYAVARYNKKTKILDVFTDRFGKKQLYYKMWMNRVVGIASEAKALADKDSKINTDYLAHIYRFGYYFGGDETIIKEVFRFKPGYWYKIKNGAIVSGVKIPFDSRDMLPKKMHGLYSLMKLSVERRFVSDVPVSLLFSGGLDSSILLHHINEAGLKCEVFTIENRADFEFASRYADELGVKMHALDIDKGLDSDKAHLACEAGCDLGSVLPNYQLFKELKRVGFKVALSADAADEIFGGYRRMLGIDCQRSDIFYELMSYHFPRLDKLSMAHTVELRCPFAAQYIIDFGLRLSYDSRIGKKFLKNEYRSILPDYIIDRPKEPLKIASVMNDPIAERYALIKLWQDKLFKIYTQG